MEIGNSGLGVKVMTDDQMEMLRKQISVYASLCESLVQMHKSVSAQPHFPGMGVYSGPVLSYALNKIPSRQRWAPKPEQLQILESIFEQSNATPDRQKIKEITAQLTLHGQISETNVYNWFQNRRARSKRKHSTQPTPNTRESEVEPEPAKEKKTKSDECQLDENLAVMVSHMYFQSPEIGGIEQLIGTAEVPMSYGADWQMDRHDWIG